MSSQRTGAAGAALVSTAIILLGLNLRPIMAAVGPLLDRIQGDTGLTDIGAGLLTTLPIFAMGVIALLGAALQKRLGAGRAIGLGLAAIGAACVVRLPWTAPAGLIASAALGGMGIAVIQALAPGFIKAELGAGASHGMALFTTGIMGGAALSSALASPLANTLGWPAALALWAALAVLAGLVWQRVAGGRGATAAAAAYHLPWRAPRAWLLMAFFGIGTAAYTLILAWLPPFYTGLGYSASASGLLLGGLTLCQVAAGLTLSSLIGRIHDRRPLLAGVLVTVCLGLAMLIVAPATLALPAIVVLGASVGALFPLSLIVSLDHLDTRHADAAGALMGFVQGGGYVLASVMPLVAGALRESGASLSLAWALMIVALLAQLALVPVLAPADRLDPRGWRLSRGAAHKR